jgi:aerobic-type carbon monoxide dehydrogenase small subunit (CoxS/CutS family)
MAEKLTLNVDGKAHTISVDDPKMPLLYALRDELGFHNPRFGCGLGQCGACTVHIDGQAVRSCVTPVSAVTKRKITTLAGLGIAKKPHKPKPRSRSANRPATSWLDHDGSRIAGAQIDPTDGETGRHLI